MSLVRKDSIGLYLIADGAWYRPAVEGGKYLPQGLHRFPAGTSAVWHQEVEVEPHPEDHLAVVRVNGKVEIWRRAHSTCN